MATITLKGDEILTLGSLPSVGNEAPEFTLTKKDLSDVSLSHYKGKKVILNIFPSIDTAVCSASVRHFNQEISKRGNTVVLCISRDLPFAQARFCASEGIDNVELLSEFKNRDFSKTYQVQITTGSLSGLHSRAIIFIDEAGIIRYTEQVPEITREPDYEKVLNMI